MAIIDILLTLLREWHEALTFRERPWPLIDYSHHRSVTTKTIYHSTIDGWMMGVTVLILRVLLIQFNVIHFQYTIRMWIKPYLMDSPSDKVLQLRLVLHSDSPETSKAGWMMSDGCKGCCCCTSLACAYVASSSSSVVVVAIKGNWTWRDRHFWADSVGEAPRGHHCHCHCACRELFVAARSSDRLLGWNYNNSIMTTYNEEGAETITCQNMQM